MENHTEIWRQCELSQIVKKIKTKKEVLQRVMLTYPGLTSVYLNLPLTQEIFERAGLDMIKQEVCTVFRQVDSLRTGTIKMTKLLRFVVDL